ncbi:MAG TPA: ATP-binding cassette domain-containing protein [Lachnospiraceae bacterium]
MDITDALSLENVSFRYLKDGKRKILDEVNLNIKKGTLTVIMGGSGCGKSSLAAVASGLYPENGGYLLGGKIFLFGKDLKDLSPKERAKYLSLMFQNPNLQFCMENLRQEFYFCMENMQVAPEVMDERIEKTARKMGLSHLLERPLETLSGGEKQRAALACLVLMDSACLFLDEPFANLDSQSSKELLQDLENLKKSGKTIVVIDHKADLWLPLADEIILLTKGAKVKCRGICKENIDSFKELFEEEGLFFPRKQERKSKILEGKDKLLEFFDFSVRKKVQKKSYFWKRKKEGDFLLEKFTGCFYKGQMTAILGESGSGKTTFLKALLKEHPYEGKLFFEGEDLSFVKKKSLYKKTGIVFQNPANQFISQNVKGEVLDSLFVWGKTLEKEKQEQMAMESLKDFGLEKYHRYSPYMLSQGQQRRLAVLSVLLGGQSLLLLDEPTYGQDQKSAYAIMEKLQEKVEKEEITLIFITHDEDLAWAFADRIYRLEEKTLVEVEDDLL